MTLGQRIAHYRNALGLSQEALGAELGVTRQSVSKWESDGALPEIDKLIALSRRFGCSLDVLLGIEAETTESAPEPDMTPKAAPADRLTEAQLRMVEAIVARYIAALPDPPKPKRLATILNSCAIVILAIALMVTSGNLNDRYYHLNNNLASVNNSLSYRIDMLSDNLTGSVTESNQLVLTSSVELMAIDLAANTVTFQLQATPKVYAEGMMASFTARSGFEVTTEDATLDDGRCFIATLTCPLSDDITLSVAFKSGETEEIALLESYYDLLSNSFPTIDMDLFTLVMADITPGKAVEFTQEHYSVSYCEPEKAWPYHNRPEFTDFSLRLCKSGETIWEVASPDSGDILLDALKRDGLWESPMPAFTLTMTETDTLYLEATVTDSLGRTHDYVSIPLSIQDGMLLYGG